jgi:F0F1-type ATP synthase assembly protein I
MNVEHRMLLLWILAVVCHIVFLLSSDFLFEFFALLTGVYAFLLAFVMVANMVFRWWHDRKRKDVVV